MTHEGAMKCVLLLEREFGRREGVNAEEELKHIVKLLNKNMFKEPGAFRLELQVQRRPNLGGVTAFVILVQDGHVNVDRKTVFVPIPPITLCWGMGNTAESACEIALRKFMSGGDLVHRYIPFTFGSVNEFRLKAAVLGWEVPE